MNEMKITVFLGANEGNTPLYGEKAAELGKWIAANGHTLVYGGSNSGLMGKLADAVLHNGGKVIGVEPQFFIDRGYEHPDITQLIITETMAERKKIMIESGEAFIAFPGGTGTLEEISEVMSRIVLKKLDSLCILYNLGGYYDGLKTLLQTMVANGFSSADRQQRIFFADDLKEIEKILTQSYRAKLLSDQCC